MYQGRSDRSGGLRRAKKVGKARARETRTCSNRKPCRKETNLQQQTKGCKICVCFPFFVQQKKGQSPTELSFCNVLTYRRLGRQTSTIENGAFVVATSQKTCCEVRFRQYFRSYRLRQIVIIFASFSKIVVFFNKYDIIQKQD